MPGCASPPASSAGLTTASLGLGGSERPGGRLPRRAAPHRRLHGRRFSRRQVLRPKRSAGGTSPQRQVGRFGFGQRGSGPVASPRPPRLPSLGGSARLVHGLPGPAHGASSTGSGASPRPVSPGPAAEPRPGRPASGPPGPLGARNGKRDRTFRRHPRHLPCDCGPGLSLRLMPRRCAPLHCFTSSAVLMTCFSASRPRHPVITPPPQRNCHRTQRKSTSTRRCARSDCF